MGPCIWEFYLYRDTIYIYIYRTLYVVSKAATSDPYCTRRSHGQTYQCHPLSTTSSGNPTEMRDPRLM